MVNVSDRLYQYMSRGNELSAKSAASIFKLRSPTHASSILVTMFNDGIVQRRLSKRSVMRGNRRSFYIYYVDLYPSIWI